MVIMKVHSEWFWSESSAKTAGERLARKHGYSFNVGYQMRADGSHDWLLEVFTK